MAFLLVTLNHFRAIRSWAQAAGAGVSLDVSTFELEVRARRRSCTMYPQFFSIHQGEFGHGQVLGEDSDGFIGWRPYKPLSWELASEKLAFKRFLEAHGEPTPASWLAGFGEIPVSFLMKRSRGSFGYDLAGPFRAATDTVQLNRAVAQMKPSDSTLFAEQFMVGDNVKLWFWGSEVFYAHRQRYANVHGDGSSLLRDLVEQRLRRISRVIDDSPDMKVMRSALAYQGHAWDQVLPRGVNAWLDYRYGRHYERDPRSEHEDNALVRLPAAALAQAQRLGVLLDAELRSQFGVPVLYTVDGVLDSLDRIWWLEMNSNPVVPPAGYPLMFRDLFGIDPRQIVSQGAPMAAHMSPQMFQLWSASSAAEAV